MSLLISNLSCSSDTGVDNDGAEILVLSNGQPVNGIYVGLLTATFSISSMGSNHTGDDGKVYIDYNGAILNEKNYFFALNGKINCGYTFYSKGKSKYTIELDDEEKYELSLVSPSLSTTFSPGEIVDITLNFSYNYLLPTDALYTVETSSRAFDRSRDIDLNGNYTFKMEMQKGDNFIQVIFYKHNGDYEEDVFILTSL